MAGDSARREYERLRDERRGRLRSRSRVLVGVLVVAMVAGAVVAEAVGEEWWLGVLFPLLLFARFVAPIQREVAWRKGADGEQAVGRALDALAPDAHAIHDRLIPRSRANIDHILVGPTGVWTIDAKNYRGKLEVRSGGSQLWVKGRNRSKLLEQARRQTTVVSEVLAAAGLAGVPVRPALCFVGVEWPLLFPPRTAGEVRLLSPGHLRSLNDGAVALSPAQVRRVADVIDAALRRAVAVPESGAARARTAPGPAPRSRPSPDAASAPASGVTVRRWKRFGNDRLYVNGPDGTTLGYVDLPTNAVRPVEERHRETVRDAVDRHLGST